MPEELTTTRLDQYFDHLPSWGGDCSICNTSSMSVRIRIGVDSETQSPKLYCRRCFKKSVKSNLLDINRLSAKCSCCGDCFPIYDFRPDGDKLICGSCYFNRHWECTHCHNMFNQDTEYNIVIDTQGYERRICPQCYSLGYHLIHDYGYIPEFEFYKTDKDRRTLLYFGIELEVESMGNDKTEAIKCLPDFVYVKSDSSIENGFEIVSHPMSYGWLRANEDKWNKILEIRKKGWRSYQTNTCGMHIHLSKSAFGNFHLYKFMQMFYKESNRDFILKVSQRYINDLGHWASVKDAEKNLIYKARHKSYGRNDRHTAVCLSKENSVEIRVFKGTLNPQSFWKNVEFVKALYDFSRDHTAAQMNEIDFREYLRFKRKEYPNLYYFLWGQGERVRKGYEKD